MDGVNNKDFRKYGFRRHFYLPSELNQAYSIFLVKEARKCNKQYHQEFMIVK